MRAIPLANSLYWPACAAWSKLTYSSLNNCLGAQRAVRHSEKKASKTHKFKQRAAIASGSERAGHGQRVLLRRRGDIEATADEPVLMGQADRRQRERGLGCLALHFEVLLLDVLQLVRKAIHLELVLADLGLIHVELRGHGLHLAVLVLEGLLVDLDLLCHLGPGLLAQELLQLHVVLLLLLDEQLALGDLLGLLHEAALQRVDLLDHLERGGLAALQLAPPVDVHRGLQLVLKSAAAQALTQKIALGAEEVLPDGLGLANRLGQRGLLAAKHLEIGPHGLDLLDAVLVLRLALGQRALVHTELLVDGCKVLVAADELCAQQIALGNGGLELLAHARVLRLGIGQHAPELVVLALGRHELLLLLARSLAQAVDLGLEADLLLLDLVVDPVLLGQRPFLRRNLVLELVDLVVHDLELALHVGDLALSLDEVLAVQVALAADRLVQALLLPELGIGIRELLLVVEDLSLGQLDLLDSLDALLLQVCCIAQRLVALALENGNQLVLAGRFLLQRDDLLLQPRLGRLVQLDETLLRLRVLARLHHLALQNIPRARQVLQLLAVVLRLPRGLVEVPLQRVRLALDREQLGLQLDPLVLACPQLLVQDLHLPLQVAALCARGCELIFRGLQLLLETRRVLSGILVLQGSVVALLDELGDARLQCLLLGTQLIVLNAALMQLLVQAAHLVCPRADLGLAALDVARLGIELRLVCLDLPLQRVPLARLALRVCALRGDLLLQLDDICIRGRLGGLGGLLAGSNVRHLGTQSDDVPEQLVALHHQVVLLLQHKRDVLAVGGCGAGALLDHGAHRSDLLPQALDRILEGGLVLASSIEHLPSLIDLLLQRCNSGLIISIRHGRLQLGRACEQLCIELAALAHQALLAIM
eukprot:m.235648 g.235648  ORF g.235648 m.235648 type:complete len:879 (-) comp12857_c0_seq1:210-2846(-)